jgi:hypothetical protein
VGSLTEGNKGNEEPDLSSREKAQKTQKQTQTGNSEKEN